MGVCVQVKKVREVVFVTCLLYLFDLAELETGDDLLKGAWKHEVPRGEGRAGGWGVGAQVELG